MAGHLVPPWESSNDAHCQLPYVEDDGDKTRGNMCACSRDKFATWEVKPWVMLQQWAHLLC
eukprot:619304-Amphidinium_carterae.1